MTTLRTILLGAALGAALLAGACRATSGYLSDYSRLGPNPDAPGDRSARLWVAPGDALLDCDRLLIETYALRPKSGSFLAKIDRGTARELVDALRERMIAVVDPYYSVVSEPGEGVLRMRVAITDLTFRGDDRDPADASGIAFEVEMLDSRTGQQLAAATRSLQVPDGTSAYDALAERLLAFMNQQTAGTQ